MTTRARFTFVLLAAALLATASACSSESSGGAGGTGGSGGASSTQTTTSTSTTSTTAGSGGAGGGSCQPVGAQCDPNDPHAVTTEFCCTGKCDQNLSTGNTECF